MKSVEKKKSVSDQFVVKYYKNVDGLKTHITGQTSTVTLCFCKRVNTVEKQ